MSILVLLPPPPYPLPFSPSLISLVVTVDFRHHVYFPTQADTTENWYKGGASRSKTLVGLATYGRTFKLADPSDNGVGARAIGPGKAGKYTNVTGFLTYFEVGIIYTEMTCCELGTQR